MKFLLVFALAVACASARPDIGLSRTYIPSGYSYGPGRTYYSESSSYGSPSSYSVHVPSNYFEVPAVRREYYVDGGYRNAYDLEDNVVYNGGSSSSTRTNVLTKTNVHHIAGPGEVTRQNFFYDAGDDDVISRTSIHVPVAPTKKNVNTVFVKAPHYGHNTHIVAPQQQAEEKTKVVVLVKKPEADQHITIPALAPPKPSKPEVHFVKYDNQNEAEHKIQATLNGNIAVTNHAHNLGSEGGLLNSIARSAAHKHEVGVTVDKYVNDASEAQYENNIGLSSGSDTVITDSAGRYRNGYTTVLSGEPSYRGRNTVTTVIKDLGVPSSSYDRSSYRTVVRGDYDVPPFVGARSIIRHVDGVPIKVYASDYSTHPGYTYKK